MRIDQLNPNHPSNVEVMNLVNDGVKVSWDDEIPNWMENRKIHVTTNQIGLKPHDQSGSWPTLMIKYDSTAYLDEHRERVIFISPISKV